MRHLAVLRALAWGFVALGLVAAIGAWVAPALPAPTLAAVPDAAPLVLTPNASQPLDQVASVVASGDLFRRSRRPSSRTSVALAPPTEPTAPKPVLRLVGLVVGANPTAVIEGFPGAQGPRVVRPGDVIGGLTVHAIAATGVQVIGRDTAWVLTVKRP